MGATIFVPAETISRRNLAQERAESCTEMHLFKAESLHADAKKCAYKFKILSFSVFFCVHFAVCPCWVKLWVHRVQICE